MKNENLRLLEGKKPASSSRSVCCPQGRDISRTKENNIIPRIQTLRGDIGGGMDTNSVCGMPNAANGLEGKKNNIKSHAEFISASSTQVISQGQQLQSSKILNQVQNDFINEKAFTLIELLVVVLIIGILAAIAVPQYQLAVVKSRFTAMLPLMRSLKNAQERYYMENGEYAISLLDLDIQMPAHCEMWSRNKNMWFCGNEWYIDNTLSGKPVGILSASFCPGNPNRDNYRTCELNAIASLNFYYDAQTSYTLYPTRLGQTTCTSNKSLGKKLCKTLLNN